MERFLIIFIIVLSIMLYLLDFIVLLQVILGSLFITTTINYIIEKLGGKR